MVYCVAFTIELKHDADVSRFIEGFRELQRFVVHHEPGTVTYELHHCMVPGEGGEGAPLVRHPRRFTVIERYRTQRDFEEVHLKSKTFADFFALVNSLESVETVLQQFVRCDAAIDKTLDTGSPMEPPQPTATKGVAVLAGSRMGTKPEYEKAAHAVGELIVKKMKQPFIYGGGSAGLMGAASKAAAAAGGRLVCVMPELMLTPEKLTSLQGQTVYPTQSLAELKSIMLTHCHSIIILPGGLGAFDEIYEYIALFQQNHTLAKIGFVNIAHFFDPLFAELKHLIHEGFMDEEVMSYFVVEDSAEKLVDRLETFQVPQPSCKFKWGNAR